MNNKSITANGFVFVVQQSWIKSIGNFTCGVFLSYLDFKYGKYADISKMIKESIDENEMPLTDKEIIEDLCIGAWELKALKQKLSDLGLIEFKSKGMPAKTYYKLLYRKEEL